MTISSAYIFAKQIKAAAIPSNVIFDGGFNLQRMKPGFDMANNKYIVQDLYPNMDYDTGEMAILNGVFETQIAQDDGACLITYGTDHDLLTLVDGYLEHVGDSLTPTIDGCQYFFPVNMRKLSEEGYTKINITLDYCMNAVQTGGDNLSLQILWTNGNRLSSLAAGVWSCPSSSTLTESTFSMGFDSDNGAPSYIRLAMSSGTYHVKKIWFE